MNTTNENTMTTGNKTDVDLRSRTLFAEDCFLAGRIAELESAVKEWDLGDQAAVQSATYFGNGRWEYRDKTIEGLWLPRGDYEFVAMSDLNEVQPQKFSQATT